MTTVKLSEKEIELIRFCQGNIPVCEDPFGEIARQLDVDESWLYRTLRRWKKYNVLRRFIAILYHQNAGYDANGMAVWNVPDDRVEEIGRKIASYPEISHCYHRPKLPGWPYNVYGMLHGRSEREVKKTAKTISQDVGIDNYHILFSVREFKKSSMQYFVPEMDYVLTN